MRKLIVSDKIHTKYFGRFCTGLDPFFSAQQLDPSTSNPNPSFGSQSWRSRDLRMHLGDALLASVASVLCAASPRIAASGSFVGSSDQASATHHCRGFSLICAEFRILFTTRSSQLYSSVRRSFPILEKNTVHEKSRNVKVATRYRS